jgi:hypothetical protein
LMLEEVLPHVELDCTGKSWRGRVVRCDDHRGIGESTDKGGQGGTWLSVS